MGKCLGIDFGLKRTGVSISDEFNKIAFPLKTVQSDNLISILQDIIKTESIEKIIIGKPYDLKGNLPVLEENIISLIKLLKTKFPNILVFRIDERFTSKIAKQTIAISGASKIKRRNKENIDKISATLILQSYLNK
ncbi:MAG: Holliday junction resolvase RuvX [Candidatus Marisimplicoccus sp.]